MITLPHSCAGCCHFDGDCHCALPVDMALIGGFIAAPTQVVCVKFERACARCGEFSGDEALCDDCLTKAGEAQSQARLEA